MLTFGEDVNLMGCEAPTIRCTRCGAFKDIAAEYAQAHMAAYADHPGDRK